jgi:16S rRNA (cytosine1402-N4)-methyltransferase
MKHTPVYLEEFIEAQNIVEGGKYIDATYGQGGYTQAIIERGGEVMAIDADARQIERAPHKNNDQVHLVHGSYCDIKELAATHSFYPVDGVVFDLGLSYEQMMQSERGFSYQMSDQPLDMRLDAESGTETAAQVLKSRSKDELYTIFSHYGEELAAEQLAEYIVATRKQSPIVTVGDLVALIDAVILERPHQSYARIFQALRMEVNQELEQIKAGITGAVELLKDGGYLVVVTFHSIEDRLVKRLFQSNHQLSHAKRVTKSNPMPFERSATLRVAQKKS